MAQKRNNIFSDSEAKSYKNTYSIHIEPKRVIMPQAPAAPQAQTVKIVESKEPIQKAPEYTFLKAIWPYIKFVLASGIIFLLIFFALNWSAYKKIFLSKIEQMTQTNQESPLDVFVSDSGNIMSANGELLEISQNPDLEKTKIPPLQLDIYPPDTRIIIPRINQNIPVVKVSKENLLKKDWGALEQDIQNALKEGVVHYPGTAFFGEPGNVAITGHSSYYPWDPGRFKDVFALLHDVQMGDTIIIYSGQKKYTYQVNDIKIVLPQDVDVLKPTEDDRLTLITCTPVGTNLKRLIVTAKKISVEN
jgi:LPXTG-site transpeptidase (sortase) family protein